MKFFEKMMNIGGLFKQAVDNHRLITQLYGYFNGKIRVCTGRA